MTETRTFKNVYGVFDTASAIHAGWDVQCTEDLEPAEFFNSDEWDMEVTFTRKVKPVEAHTWVETGKRGKEVSVYVLAIHGRMAWVSEDPDGLAGGALTAWTENVSALRRR